MSVFMMSKGETIEIYCPSRFANGGATVYSHFDSETVPADTDLRFKIEILECETQLESANKVNLKYKLEPLKSMDLNQKLRGTGKIV